ncbi:hypothetical protein SAMN05192558_107330 [Actinokineospora alba]|uniref:Uncharacterized protein n=1 Tax=Actinokineospora alba TaxID=504798 RepID=A0A1H0R766_9PSEU|nr:hypothetical protein C8E96_5822 [Actinokineospora alba]SDI36552.1 hypothetical protein SAMN05421871_104329 [Actinokineospora alba]SDP25280.1 hypothetical protein SAMN05192558_107330 [Actinokineospora alba]
MSDRQAESVVSQEFTAEDHVAGGDGQALPEPGRGLRRLRPTVSFGLRAAALAGLVVTAGAATAVGFSGIFDDPANLASWPTSTTCCPEKPK